MKTKLIVAALALLMTSGAHAGMPLNADDPWAKAIGDTRTLEKDRIGCVTQREVDIVKAVQRGTTGVSMEMLRCVLFMQGEAVVVVNLEYGAGSCGPICAQIHLVGDQRRYWMDAPVELL
jgi:hypothetical protein